MKLSRILLYVTMVTVTSTNVWSRNCPYGWLDRPYSDKCYFFTQNSATNNWYDSRMKCTSAGGDLASIRSKQDWDYLNHMMRQLYATYNRGFQHWWLGLNKRDDGSTWKWADGSTANMSLLTWGKNVPTNDKNKACVQMNLFVMDVGSCAGNTFQSICSRPKGLPIQCDANNGWQHYNGMCYRYFNTARTWGDASKACRNIGATLPIIPDLTTQTIVADFARQQKTNLWTGLRSSGKPNSILWVWQDGSRLAGNPYWVPGQPPPNMNSRISTTCVELNTNGRLPSTWVANICQARRKYYCQRPEGTCADGWLEYGAMCYQFNPHFQLSWPKANTYCKSQGGNLVAITNADIQAFLNQYLGPQNQVGVTEIWIGLTDNNKDSGPWVFTAGGSPGTWNNWVSTPVNHHGHQDCVYIVTSGNRAKWRIANSCTQVRSFICQIKTNTQVKTITQPPNHYICDANWVSNGKYCYYFNENDNTYDVARDWCQRQKADLVWITDSSVQSFLESKIQHQGDYWIGLTDRHREGWWAWLDDANNSTFYYWDRGEPNNWQGKENCARMYATGSPSRFGRWADEPCSTQRFNFICQKQSQNAYNTPPTTTPKPMSSRCGPLWESDPFSPFCYQFSTEQLTWPDARGLCRTRGGDLVSIQSSEESSYITGRIRQMNSADFWIGANDQSTEGGWQWTDGKAFAFINWNAGEPNNFGNSEDCGAILSNTGRWHGNYCGNRKGFICKKSAYFVCATGWLNFKANCFNFNHDKKTWQAARSWCKTQGSDLARVINLDLLGFLRDHVDGSGEWWIGLNDIHTEGTFVWLDDKQPTFTGAIQWKPGEPNQQGNEDCVSIAMTLGAANEGKYNDWPCSKSNNFVCMKPARQVSATVMPQTTTPNSVPAGSMYGCPLNWRGFRGSCYYFAWNTGSYDSSIRQCGYQGSKVVSIIDDAENKFVFSMIPKSLSQPGKAIWIGLNDRSIEMKYVWLDGERVTYTNWHKDEPNNWQGHDEDCVAMYTQDGMWNDRICTEKVAGTVCKRPKTIIPNSQLEIGKGCQTGQIGYHTTCYQFHWNPTKTWSDAEKDCVSHKGHLATIPGRHVQAFLGAEMLNKGSTWWVGISDMQTPGQYKWSSGQPFSFSAWYETHTGNERSTCAGIRSGRPAGLWENRNCTDHRSYICEYPRTGYTTLATTPTTTPSPLPCPNSWTAFNGVCYKFFGATPSSLKSWPAARDVCQGLGGDLVSIHNSSLEAFFTTTLLLNQTSFWIGLNDRDTENGYQWTDRSQFGYSNWASGEPNNYNSREDCAEFNPLSKAWNDFYCYDAKGFVCQLQKGIQLTTTQAPAMGSTSPQCVGNGTWYFYNNNCYMKSPPNGTDAQKTWFDARRYCMSQGGDLASIHGPDDNAFLTAWTSPVVDKLKFWIGLTNLDMSGYQWSDGTAVQYLGWELHQPNDGGGEKRCVFLQNHRGTWFDENCNDVLEFICEKRPLNSQPRTPPPTAIVPGGCPVGFSTIPTSNRCYIVQGTSSSQRRNWTDANAICQGLARGANLAVITNARENKFVVTLMKGAPGQAWIGLMDRRTNGRYMWVDSTEVDYTAWAPGQPDEDVTNDKIQHRRDCVMMWHLPTGVYKAGGWDDYFCDNVMAYICSVPKTTIGFATPTPNTAGCPAGYVRYGNSCYKGMPSVKAWSDAQMDCAMNHANLTSIADVFEESFVNLIMLNQGQSWIGLSNLESNGHYTWTDKYPVTFTRWGYKEPSTLPGEGCVLMKTNFKWNDTQCSDYHNYICETHVSGGPVTTPVIVGHCPDSTWTVGRDYCYKAVGSMLKSWPEARYMCQRMGGKLASVGSQAEMTLILNMLTNNATDIWIGLSKQEDGGFMWTDRSAVNFLYWAHNEPSDPNNQMHQDCVLMMAAGGWRWNDLDCFSRAGYICKAAQSTSTYPTKPQPVTQKPQTQGPYTQRSYTQGNHRTQNTPYNPFNTPFIPLGTPYHPSYTGKGPINTPAPLVRQPVPSPSGLSGGAIAGIILGVIAILALGSIAFVVLRRKFLPRSALLGFTNATYDKHHDDVSVS